MADGPPAPHNRSQTDSGHLPGLPYARDSVETASVGSVPDIFPRDATDTKVTPFNHARLPAPDASSVWLTLRLGLLYRPRN